MDDVQLVHVLESVAQLTDVINDFCLGQSVIRVGDAVQQLTTGQADNFTKF